MYPLNMHNPGACGFAVASDEAEHKALSEAGYLPAFVAAEEEASAPATVESPAEPTVESVRAQLDAAGIEYDGRMGLKKLQALLPA